MKKISYSKTLDSGGGGKCRVYYSEKFKRKVVEKTVGDSFLRTKETNRARLTTLIRNYSHNENMLRKETIFMLFTQVARLDCCVEILDFSSNPFKIIMEYCEGGDLRKVLDEYEVPIQDKVEMISQILFAIKEIHEVGLIHGDLKCANIFLANKYIPGDTDNIRIKIGDFGLSEIGGSLVYGGTPGFMAPEVPLYGGSFESDIYSIGKVMLEIMTQLPVIMISVINITNIFSLKDKLPKFLNVSEFYNLVIPCLSENPKKRPDAEKLFNLFHGLMAYWVICQNINVNILKNYKIGDEVPVDSHKHPLILSNDQMRHYSGNGWYCNICGEEKVYLDNTFSFHCRICKYDLCEKCIEEHNYNHVNNMMLKHIDKGKKAYVSQHGHFLLLSNKKERNYGEAGYWICDICKAEISDSVYSFHCKKCTYDVCLKCYKDFFVLKDDCCCIIY